MSTSQSPPIELAKLQQNAPIGLFDSGFGGLTVMKEIIRLLPNEHLIYLGDTAHLPYGNKSPETVRYFAQDNASFLVHLGIKLLIIPCHTACTHALEILQQTLPIPVIGVIQPGLNLLTKCRNLAVIGTSSTIKSGVYQSLIQQQFPHIQVFAQECPLFVPLIEEGLHNHPAARLIAETYLLPLKNRIDSLLLACTHYPLMRPTLQAVLGEHVQLIEPAQQCALATHHLLTQLHLLNTTKTIPTYRFFASDDPSKFCRLGQHFLELEIESVEKKVASMKPF